MASQKFSNLSKFTTPELSKREGAKPYNPTLQRRESFGQLSSPFQMADGMFNFDYKDPENITKNLPKAANTQQPERKVFRSEIHRDPVRIPIRMMQNDGNERIIGGTDPLDMNRLKQQMEDRMQKLKDGSGFPDMDFMPSTGFFKMKQPPTSRSKIKKQEPTTNQAPPTTAPSEQKAKNDKRVHHIPIRRVNESTEDNNQASNGEGQKTPNDSLPTKTEPPKTFAKPTHISENVKNIKKPTLVNGPSSRDSLDAVDTASDQTNDLGHQVKTSPPVPRKNTNYHNSRRNSLKITPEFEDEALKMQQFAKEASEKLNDEKRRQELEEKEAQKQQQEETFSAATPVPDNNLDDADEEQSNTQNTPNTILSKQFFQLHEEILKLAFELSSIQPNFEAQDLVTLKKQQKLAVACGEFLMRILFTLDAMQLENSDERISKKVVSSIGYFWIEKADYIDSQIRDTVKAKEEEGAESDGIDC